MQPGFGEGSPNGEDNPILVVAIKMGNQNLVKVVQMVKTVQFILCCHSVYSFSHPCTSILIQVIPASGPLTGGCTHWCSMQPPHSGHASVPEANINVYKFTYTRAPRNSLIHKFMSLRCKMRPNFTAPKLSTGIDYGEDNGYAYTSARKLTT